MIPSRREFGAGLAASLLAPASALARSAPRAFAAGPPAALLVWAIAPASLVGWPRGLSREQLSHLAPRAAILPQTGGLTAADPAASLEAVLARRPALVIDYGDLTGTYRSVAQRTRRRLSIPYHLLDGRLRSTPAALRAAGRLLGAEQRAAGLAGFAETALAQWARARGRGGPSFYYARGADGLETGATGSTATEVLEGAGWRNVVPAARQGLARFSAERLIAADPAVVVTLDAGFAARAAASPLWSKRASGRRRPVVLLADAPFGWLDRPPSVNRLLGAMWAALPDPLGPVPNSFIDEVRRFHAGFYGRGLHIAGARRLLPRVFT